MDGFWNGGCCEEDGLDGREKACDVGAHIIIILNNMARTWLAMHSCVNCRWGRDDIIASCTAAITEVEEAAVGCRHRFRRDRPRGLSIMQR